MEIDANGDIEQRERSLSTGGRKGQLTVLIAIPKNASFREFHRLFAFYGLTLSGIGSIQRELYLLTTDNAHRHIRLLLKTLDIEQ